MSVYLSILAFLLLDTTLSVHSNTDSVGCADCGVAKIRKQRNALLGVGESCGVYTPDCELNLRCVAPKGLKWPMLSLVDGYGVCVDPNDGSYDSTDDNAPLGQHEPHCQQVLQYLTDEFRQFGQFQPNAVVYFPRCDSLGYFKLKQCTTAVGRISGKCWCGDVDGSFMYSRRDEAGTLCS